MDSVLLLQMIIAALSAVLIYMIIGFIPGTDETSVLMPITLTMVLSGAPAIVVLTFFIAAIVTLNLTNSIPTALVGLPGGVLSSPMLEHSLDMKNRGLAAITVKKIAAGAVIGVLISVPLALIIGRLLAPLSKEIQAYAPLLFVFGAIFLSLIGRNKLLALFSIIPLAMLFMGLRYLYWGMGVVPEEKSITTSFFLGITIGPLLVSLLSLLNKKLRESQLTSQEKVIVLPDHDLAMNKVNPFKILTKAEQRTSALSSVIANFLFVLSPVGLILLIGETVAKREKNPIEKSSKAVSTMGALAQSTYLSGIIIPIVALGIPLSPTAIGPGSALFNAPPVFTLDHNLHHILKRWEMVLAIVLGALIAISITYWIVTKYAHVLARFVLKHIPHEAILSLFVALIILLSFMDAGLVNVFGVLLIGLVAGSLNKMGVNYGVQFMTLYAAPWLVEQLARF